MRVRLHKADAYTGRIRDDHGKHMQPGTAAISNTVIVSV